MNPAPHGVKMFHFTMLPCKIRKHFWWDGNVLHKISRIQTKFSREIYRPV